MEEGPFPRVGTDGIPVPAVSCCSEERAERCHVSRRDALKQTEVGERGCSLHVLAVAAGTSCRSGEGTECLCSNCVYATWPARR